MHDRLVDVLVILVVNAGIGVMYWAIRRWFVPIRRGYIGLMMIFLPMGFDALDLQDETLFGGTSNSALGIYILFAIIGVFILISDVTGKIYNEELRTPSPPTQGKDD